MRLFNTLTNKKEEFKINYLKDEYNNKIIKVNSIEYDVK